MKLLKLVISFLFTIVPLLFLILFFIYNSRRVINNIKTMNSIKRGVIVKSEISEVNTDLGAFFDNESTVFVSKEKDTLKSHNYFEAQKGDTVKLRYVGTKENNIIFEVNGEVVGSKYDIWDYSSPFLMLFSGFLIYWIYLAKYIDRFKKRNFKTFLIFLATVSTSYSQSFDIQCSSSPYLSFEANSFKTHKYEQVYMATKTYTNLNEVKNEFPEQLIESEMSVIGQAWLSFLTIVSVLTDIPE